MARTDRPPRPAARPAAPRTPHSAGSEREARIAMLVLTVLGGILRLFHFGQSPPGLNQDEAVNAWNAWCLLKTGKDMVGHAWPVFYAHAIGDNRTTLYFYALLPFQALGGLNVWTTRLPNAVAGIACVPLVYYVGSRLFGRATGVAAAAIMAIEPWPLFMSRWGIEGGLCPFLALATLALMLAARLPVGRASDEPPRPGVALIAGLVAGVACYGYWPMRLFIPALLLGLALVQADRWVATFRTRAGARAIVAFVAGVAVTLGPLALVHLTDPAIAVRAQQTRLWEPGASFATIVSLVATRWASHYGRDFLFQRGDLFDIVRPIGQGEFNWAVAPLFAIGALAALVAARRAPAARTLLVLVAVYPAGDVISRYPSVHALRSAPGIGALALLGGYGAARAWTWLRLRGALVAQTAAALFTIVWVTLAGRYFTRYFGEYDRQPAIYHGYQADLLEASQWLRSRLNDTDAVYCTTAGMNEPFAITLVGLGYDPARWFDEPREVRIAGDWDIVLRYGKLHFLYGPMWRGELERLRADGKPERVTFIVRPGELGLSHPVYAIRGPEGQDVLWIVQGTL